MRFIVPHILYGALLTVALLPTSYSSLLQLCDLREEDGLQCECNDNEANCEVTRPLTTINPVIHRNRQSPPAEAAKRRRDVRRINSLVLLSPRNESFLGKFPADIFEEPLQFKSISMAHASLGELTSYAVSGSRFLRELTLTACGISALLKNAISGLENLKRIDLSHNQISHIRVGSLNNLPSLKQLIISHSGVSDIEPHAFVELSSLEKLSLKDNNLKQVSNLLFSGLTNLQEVILNFNHIQKLDDNTFADLPRLRHVDLAGNYLTVITPKTFRSMRDLSHLDLHYNNLKYLPVGFLKDSPKLQELNLERNRLESVDLNTLRGVRAIRSDFILRIKANPLNCSCDLFYLTELRKRRTAGLDNDEQDPPEFASLQCRERMSEHFEPRSIDDYFVKSNCEHDSQLSEHIVDETPVRRSHASSLHPAYTFMILLPLLALLSCFIVKRLL